MIRFCSFIAGVAILAASAFAVIQHTSADEAQQALIWASAGGLVIGAAVVSYAKGYIQWCIIGFLACGELYGALTSFERVIEVREGKAAIGRAQANAIVKATTRLNAAEGALAIARQDVADKAPLKDCKVNCKDLLQAAVNAATIERDTARKAVEALPPPETADVFAAQTGIPAWKISMALALLLSLATNGLGATLVAYAAHAEPVVARPSPVDFRPAITVADCDSPVPDYSPSVRQRTRTEKQKALSDLLDMLSRGHSIPSQDYLAMHWNRPKQTVSDWIREWRRIGVIPSETRVGRCKATVPA